MSSLIIKELEDNTLRRLRMRAANHGISVEEEARQIIKKAVSTPERLGDLAVRLFAPAYGGQELELPEREITDPMEISG